MQEDLPRFVEAGGQVAVVTLGTAEQAAAFFPEPDLAMTVLADPGQEAYRAFGLDQGSLWQIAGPKVWAPSIKAMFRGGIGKPTGDVRQLPGAFVVDRQGVVRFVHRAAHQADRPDHAAMLAVLRRIATE